MFANVWVKKKKEVLRAAGVFCACAALMFALSACGGSGSESAPESSSVEPAADSSAATSSAASADSSAATSSASETDAASSAESAASSSSATGPSSPLTASSSAKSSSSAESASSLSLDPCKNFVFSDVEYEIVNFSDSEEYPHWGIHLSGKLTNNNKDGYGKVYIGGTISEVRKDKYGDDEVEEADIPQSLLNSSCAYGVDGNVFYEMAAGETRDFSYYYTSTSEKLVDPVLEVVEVGDMDDGFHLVKGGEISIEVDRDTRSIMLINNTDKLFEAVDIKSYSYRLAGEGSTGPSLEIDGATCYYPSSADHVTIEHLRPHASYPVARFNTDDKIVSYDLTSVLYCVDEEGPAAPLSAEFDIEKVPGEYDDSCAFEVTNKTGKYIDQVELLISYIADYGYLETSISYFDPLKPGATATSESFRYGDVDTVEVYDIVYREDPDKKSN